MFHRGLLWSSSLLLLTWSISGGLSTSDVVGLVNGSVLLESPEELPEQYQDIVWDFNSTWEILEWKNNGGGKVKIFPHFNNRIRFSQSNGSLWLTGLQKEDSGQYGLKVTHMNNVQNRWMLKLRVYDKVSNVTVEVINRTRMDGKCHFVLECQTGTPGPLNFYWRFNSSFFLGNWILNGTKEPQGRTVCYTCRAENPGSSAENKTCFPDSCIPGSTSEVGCSSWLVMLIPTVLGLLFSHH
ncbi:CD48 antigen [Tachyglossus aculeatus]|uniref:CD48 antigen n=1 Tax=Tachyglossus aculeatus TaxID=9261 RepID=UPI0018F4567E|nr:CD48 antigen [Tachyglossus aculeatus]